jgi:hypothetical protein
MNKKNERIKRKLGHPVLNINIDDKTIDGIREKAKAEVVAIFGKLGADFFNLKSSEDLINFYVETLTLANAKVYMANNKIGERIDHQTLKREGIEEAERLRGSLRDHVKRMERMNKND